MVTVTVYSTGPACQRCRLTCRCLSDHRIPYRVVDLTDDAHTAAREFLTDDLGYTEAPVVIVDDDPQHHWSGFRPDLIATLATHHTPAPPSRPQPDPAAAAPTPAARLQTDRSAAGLH